MHNLATKREPIDISHEAATVISARPLRVRASSGEQGAERASSCLLEPKAGDLVTLALLRDGRAFVTAVLTRPGERGVELEVAEDLTLRAGGRVRVEAAEGVEMTSSGEIRVASAALHLRAGEGTAAFDRLSFWARTLLGKVERAKHVAGTVEMVAERVSQTVQRCYRFVGEFEQLRAGRIDYRAESNLSMTGKNTVVTAERLVKVDGEQIHLG